MMLSVHWTEQLVQETVFDIQAGNEQTMLRAVMEMIEFLYSLEKEEGMTNKCACQYALEVFPKRWHPIIHEVLRMKQNNPSLTSFFSTEEKSTMARAFMSYTIHYCNEKYRLFN